MTKSIIISDVKTKTTGKTSSGVNLTISDIGYKLIFSANTSDIRKTDYNEGTRSDGKKQ